LEQLARSVIRDAKVIELVVVAVRSLVAHAELRDFARVDAE
jgi:hypothetical protein